MKHSLNSTVWAPYRHLTALLVGFGIKNTIQMHGITNQICKYIQVGLLRKKWNYSQEKTCSQFGNFVCLGVRVIAIKILRDFWRKNNETEQKLKAWYAEAMKANWSKPADIKSQYISASILKDNRVVFNIKGNDYRLVVKINYKSKMVYIRFIGTHSDYNNINAKEI